MKPEVDTAPDTRAKRNSLFEAGNLAKTEPGNVTAGRYLRWSWPF